MLVTLDRIEPREDHRLDLLKTGQRLRRRTSRFGDRVANLRVGNRFDVRGEEAGFSRGQYLAGHGFWGLITETLDLINASINPQLDLLPEPQRPIDNAH